MLTTSQARSIAIMLALIFGLAAALPAQNALSNPELDAPVYFDGWQLYWGTHLDWTSADSDGCPSSGAGQIQSAPFDTGAEWGVATQCVAVDPASWPYGLHGSFRYSSGIASLAYIVFFYYSDSLCGWGGGTDLGFDSADGPTGPGWHSASLSVFPLPAGIGSVAVGIGGDGGAGNTIEFLFDRAYFGGIPRILSDGFETDASTCRWSATVP